MTIDITIDDIVELLGLEKNPRYKGGSSSYNVKCPFCDDPKYHLNINSQKGVYNCVRCTGKSGGGYLDLYARCVMGSEHIKGTSGNGKEIIKKIKEELNIPFKSQRKIEVTTKKEKKEWKSGSLTRASDSVLNKTYSCILNFNEFKLSEQHYKNLIKRGLDAEKIKRNGYASLSCEFVENIDEEFMITVADERRLYNLKKKHVQAGIEIADYCLKKGCTLLGVPGFYKLGYRWVFKVEEGMAIPTRNIKGEIICLQIRKDAGKLRYMTVSSKELPCGVTEGIARTHFSIGFTADKETSIYLTEGPLKADISQHLLEKKGIRTSFIALQGVNNRKELGTIFPMLHSCGVKVIYNALDMDKLTNPHVMAASKLIREMAKSFQMEVKTKLWDEECAKIKLIKARAICRYHNIEVDCEEKDCYSELAVLSDLLYQNDIDYCVKTSLDGEKVKLYWNDNSKGIDDYLHNTAY